MEVLSPRTRNRDLGKKKTEYALAGTYEYWVIDTDRDALTRFSNVGKAFGEGVEFGVNDTITSAWLPELSFPLDAVWDDGMRQAWTKDLVASGA